MSTQVWPRSAIGMSFIKAPAFQDGHAGYSDLLSEHTFRVDAINTLHNAW
jgi:hypothetical protein